MAISATGRYASSTVVNLDVDGQVRKVIVPGPESVFTFSYQTHMWTDYDRPDNLANDYYGDATQWWNIANGNPEIMDWSQVVMGTIIRIPSLL
jgi:hypothetical protein